MIPRRKTRQIHVGKVLVGSDSPISVQSMTNANDYEGTLNQVTECAAAGANIMRMSVPDANAADVLRRVVLVSPVPIVADIHYDWRMAILAADAGAACLRINPGNIGSSDGVREVVAAARNNKCSIRIGVNGGSLEQKLVEKYGEPCADAMVESALANARILEELGFGDIKISVKSSDTMMTIEAYEKLAAACDYPLHLGVTEAGGIMDGTIKTAMAFGALLRHGIGDTIRVSLSADPVEEVRAGIKMLKAFGLSKRGLTLISCPTCSRKCIDVMGIAARLSEKYKDEAHCITAAVMGCVVNRGEASHVDVGVYGASQTDRTGMLCIGGAASGTLNNDEIFATMCAEIDRVLDENNKK
ncbi:MAG: flavodoxin-dependent (E)-4-hydroxy-3-methylbut-2-enyl-diphosphate synthase [Alphaproteobacteria bacterium]|nr:flavodoxin-dependent (E)-4-hydroxy-3-methylbut-2-enyl-diphosphate synthase [Alphaproteobacteria bacterium]